MERVVACRIEDLPPGSSRTVKTTVPPVAVFRNEDGELFATQDTCTHEDWSLGDDSDIEGCEVTCPLHLARFDLRTGQPLELPATKPLRTYPVEVEDGVVYVRGATRQ